MNGSSRFVFICVYSGSMFSLLRDVFYRRRLWRIQTMENAEG